MLHDFIYCQSDPQDGTIVLCTVQDELEAMQITDIPDPTVSIYNLITL